MESSNTAQRKIFTASSAPVVLIHGLGVDHRMWSLQAPGLQDVGPLWAPDLPGFGGCPPLPPGRRTPEAYADWLAAWLRERGVGPAHVAGYSMGGTLALLLALRHPQRVRSLALCCSSPCWGRGGRSWAGHAWAAVAGRWAMEVFQKSVLWGFSRFSQSPELRADVVDMIARADRETMLGLFGPLADLDLRPELPRVRVPALVVGGTRDWLAAPAHQRILAARLAASELHLLRGATHMLCLSRAEEFTSLLNRFFRSAPRVSEQGRRWV